jgi:hypothetical protein
MRKKAVVAYLQVLYCHLPKEVEENLEEVSDLNLGQIQILSKIFCGTTHMVIVVFSTQWFEKNVYQRTFINSEPAANELNFTHHKIYKRR